MGNYILLITIAVLACIAVQGAPRKATEKEIVSLFPNVEELELTVLFESKCPDSMRFFKTQLKPTWDELYDYFTVKMLVPYGNAQYSADAYGSINYTCQHGPEECQGNRMLACLYELTYENNMNEYINYTNCAMSLDDPPSALTAGCANILPAKTAINVNNCQNSRDSDANLAYMAVYQDAYAPDHTYVPWLIINNKHNPLLQYTGAHYLKWLVCKMYNKGPKPDACISVLKEL